MSHEVELYVGRTAVPDASLVGWHNLSEIVFAEIHFHQRARRATHRVVRETCDEHCITVADLPPVYRYFLAPAATIRKRLLIQGYTPDFCAHSWDVARRARIETYRKYVIRDDDGEVASGMALIERITLREWMELIRDQAAESPRKVFAGRKNPWHFMSLLDGPNDALVQLALLADALPDSPVWMDCTFLCDRDHDGRTPQQMAKDEQAAFADFPAGKIIVLTEGKSDTRIIDAALRAFYPEFADAYSFIDFDEFRIEGGASFLARMIKVLSGARVENRMLALFDNDAAGVEAIRTLSGVRFPRTVRLMLLPDTKLARSYPTLGPDGLRRMDVNGAGAPIELYLGRSSLAGSDEGLRPVRWIQWRPQVGRYQGVVQDKEAVSTAFEKVIASEKSSTLRRRFPEMDLLLRSIFAAFEGNTPPMV
jgi:hypothetical protein